MPRPFFLLQLAASSCLLHVAAHAETRSWTSTGGSQVSAELIAFDGKLVKLRSGNRVLDVPVTQLSPDDQIYLQTWRPPASKPEADAKPSPGKKWPDIVDAPRSYEIKLISEDEAQKQFIYQSPHYEFKAPIALSKSVMQELAVVFEATYALLNQLPVGLNLRTQQTSPLKVALVEDVSDVIRLGGTGGDEAYYLSSIDSLVSTLGNLGAKKVNDRWSFNGRDVDVTDVSLRIAQQLYASIRGPMPTWLDMGVGKYIAIMRYKDGRFFVSSQRGALIEFLKSRNSSGSDILLPELKEVMELTSAQWNALVAAGQLGTNFEASVLLVYYFLHLDGDGDSAHIAKYINSLAAGMPHAQAQDEFLLRGRTYEKLAEEVESKLRGDGIRVKF